MEWTPILFLLVLVVGGVQGNGSPRVRLSSILDAHGEWHVSRTESALYQEGETEDVKIWPMPVSVARGESTLFLPRSFAFEGAGASETLDRAFERYYDLIFSEHAPHPVVQSDQLPSSRLLVKLVVTLGSRNEEVWLSLSSDIASLKASADAHITLKP